MKLSELNPSEIQPVSAPEETSTPTQGLKLSQLNPNEVSLLPEGIYGTPGQQAIAGIEGALRGASLGASDVAETKLGLSTPEAISGRQEANPGTSLASNLAGAGALTYLTGGIAAPAEGALLKAGAAPLLARVAGHAAEGATFGLGNVVSDAALGDPNLNAQKILADIGGGAILGGGLGALSKGIEALPALVRGSSESAENPVVDVALGAKKPTSFHEMQQQVQQAIDSGKQSVELPQKAVVLDAMSRLPEEFHPTDLQLASLDSQDARDIHHVIREMPGKEGKTLRDFETIQKSKLDTGTDQAIQQIAPEASLTPDAVKGGNQAIQAFTEQYQAEKKALGPAFEALKSTPIADVDHLPGVIESFTKAVPGVARMFDTAGEDLHVLPYSSSWGLDKSTYNAVREAVKALKDNPGNFEDLSNIRGALDQHVDVLAQGKGPAQIRALKASMMDYMQDAIEQANPDIGVRDIFKRYAINEQERQAIERTFGAGVGSPEFGAVSKIKPESIGDKIFSNTANVSAAKSILAPEKFNELLGNWITEAKAAATDNGVFSSNKFNSFLRRNQDALNAAFVDNPSTLQRLKDLTTVSRVFPHSASINPSGTAKTLLGAAAKAGFDPFKQANELFEFAKEKLAEGQNIKKANLYLAGKADEAAKIKGIQGIVSRVDKAVNAQAKSILSSPTTRGAVLSGAAHLTDEEYKKHVKQIRTLSTDPNTLIDHLNKNTAALYQAAPNITQGLQTAMSSAVGFLNSKIPAPSSQYLLSQDFVPSQDQKVKFGNYYEAVNDPLSVMKQIKNASINNESLEALQNVHPHLYQEMKSKILENIDPEEAKSLSYPVKMALAKFLGQPLDENMTPQAIASNQVALNGPSLSNQSAPQQGRKSTLGGLKQLNIASRAQTQSEKDAEET